VTADARRTPLVSLDSTRSIAVGSTNPVKIGAVRAVLGVLARAAVIEGVAVASTVSDQPRGDHETIRGALARAAAARDARRGARCGD
jgi:non-canonical (house-cleaning) NTP pyrophosphatase